MTPKGAAERAIAEAGFLLTGDDWAPVTVGPFGAGAFLVPGAAGELRAVVGQWGMIRPGQPERRPEKRYQANNTRIESAAEKPTYRHAWARAPRYSRNTICGSGGEQWCARGRYAAERQGVKSLQGSSVDVLSIRQSSMSRSGCTTEPGQRSLT